ncbi:MAG TPA: acetolactate synthase small subunit [Gemmatimonadales bacterium]|nr:acetolactate synthase small subunit [Gemmatimonadales bacterium]
MSGWHALTVELDGHLATLNAAAGLLRRRNVPIKDVTIGPARAEGRMRLFAMIQTDAGTAERIAELFRKMIGVHEARAVEADATLQRELVLVRLRPAGGDAYAELLDVLGLYHASVVEESADGLVAEVSGPGSFVLSCLRALERFGVLDVARSGTLAVDRPATVPAPASLTPTEIQVP